MQTILVVEDDENQRSLIVEELSREGFRMIGAEDGVRALDLLEQTHVDLVILDVRMPGMDGMETLGRILGRQKNIPVILHTAYSTFRDHFVAWAAEAYVMKQSDLSELKAKVHEIVRRKVKVAV